MSTIQILYHSNNYLVINKPYDMVVNSNDSNIKVIIIINTKL